MGDPIQRPDPVSLRPASPSRAARLALLAQACGALAAGGLAWQLTEAVVPALIVGLLAPSLVHGTVLAVGFLMSWAVAEAPRDSPWRWIGTWLREWPRSMRVVYRLLAWRETFTTPTATAHAGTRRQPIVLIHCFAGNRGLWSVSAPWFASRGHPLVIPSFTPADGDIDAHVEPLRAAISRAIDLADDPTAPVHLVAHSMGGLIARAYLRRYGWDGIGAVVTLGTPHGGTPQAWFAAGPAARQMLPRSAWLRRLAGEEPLPPPGQMVTVISRQDNITPTPSLQTVPLARQIRLGGLGHMSYVFEPRIIDLVLRILASVERHWRVQQALASDWPYEGSLDGPGQYTGSGQAAGTRRYAVPGRYTGPEEYPEPGQGSVLSVPQHAAGTGSGRAEPQWLEPVFQVWRADESRRVEPWLDDDGWAGPTTPMDASGATESAEPAEPIDPIDPTGPPDFDGRDGAAPDEAGRGPRPS